MHVSEGLNLRILFLVHSLRRGGAEKVVLELANGFKEQGDQVAVISWLDVDEFCEPRYSGITRDFLIPKSEYQWIKSIPKSSRILIKKINNFNPDIIQIHTPNMAWLLAWNPVMVPVIHVLHGFGSITNYYSFRGLVVREISRLAMKRLKSSFITFSKEDLKPSISKDSPEPFSAFSIVEIIE